MFRGEIYDRCPECFSWDIEGEADEKGYEHPVIADEVKYDISSGYCGSY